MAAEKTANVVWQFGLVKRAERAALLRQRGATVWLTGLPASGKTTTAFALEQALVALGHPAYVLDGDNVRHGLCADLGFSKADRAENIRRVGETAKLMADAGLLVIASFISPYQSDRDQVRKTHAAADLPFVEVYVNTPLSVCEARDPKRLYERARRGEVQGVTGIDDPYEPPAKPEISLDTTTNDPTHLAELVLTGLRTRGLLRR